MSASRLEQERQLFAACLDLAGTERAAFLSRACEGDAALQHAVEELLRAHDMRTGDFASLPGTTAGATETVARYRITGVLGEGGMGTVYAAEQLEPVQRPVAIKVIRPGWALRADGAGSFLARFTAERQALAVMDHPNVAKVFDAGETSLGNPYIAMELVNGLPLTRFCDERGLTVRQRLRLFLQLCEAVQHAHQKGVIHRDLKPANVLASGAEGEPSVKVIDFGIAKAIGSEAVASQLTVAGAPVGTLAYMSPEQSGAGPADVDTRSDIYSLGVILYELLAGALPADPEEHGYARFLFLLGSGGLPISPPSTKAATVALRREIEGDLDCIALRAFDPDRSRRYPSASALAEDVERYLTDQPVWARPPSAAYRAGKFLRRYRYQAAAAGIAIVALIAGAGAAAAGYVRAARAEAIAREEAAAAREVSDFLVNTFKLADPGEARGRSVTARELLDNAGREVESSVTRSPAIRQRLLVSLSAAYGALGLHRERLDLARKAAGALPTPGRETLADASALLAYGSASHATGQFDAAREALLRAVAARRRILGPRHADLAAAQVELGNLYTTTDRFAEALAQLEEALSIRREVLGPNHPDTGRTLRMIGLVYGRRRRPGDQARSLDYYARAMAVSESALGPDHPDTAKIASQMGREQEDPAKALAYYERARATHTRLFGPKHHLVADSLGDIGRAYGRMRQFEKARAALTEAIAIQESVFGPESWQVARGLQSLGIVEAGRSGNAAARPLFERAYAIYTRQFGPDHSMTLNIRSNLGRILLGLGRPDEALPHLRAGLRGRFYLDWKDDWFDRVRTDPRFLALRAEQERLEKEKPAEKQWTTKVN